MSQAIFEVLRPSRKQLNGLPVSFAIKRVNIRRAGIEWCDARRLRFFTMQGIDCCVKDKPRRKARAKAYCPPRSITRWDYT